MRAVISLTALVAASCATVEESTLANVVVEPAAPALDRSHPLGLDDIGRAAMTRNPALLAARAAIGVKEATAAHAGAWPDPNVSIGVTQPLFADPGAPAD